MTSSKPSPNGSLSSDLPLPLVKASILPRVYPHSHSFMHLPLFDPQASDDAKNQAMQQVLDNAGDAFVDRASAAIPLLFGGQTVLAEDWRKALTENGITPSHCNAWGALTNALLKRNIIEPTDRLSKSKDVRSHGRRQPLWTVKRDHDLVFD